MDDDIRNGTGAENAGGAEPAEAADAGGSAVAADAGGSAVAPVASGKVAVYRLTAAVLAVAAAAVRSLAIIFSFDSGPGYFVEGAFLPGLAEALTAVGFIWILTSLFLVPPGSLPVQPDFSTGKVYFAGVFAAFIMISDGCYRVYGMLRSDSIETVRAVFDRSSTAYLTGRNARIAFIMTAVCVLASFGSAMCFFTRAEGKKNRISALVGLFPIIRATCGIALTHFDMTVTMNSPVKMMTEFALMASMVFFLYEDRFDISAEKARPRLYFTSALAAQLLCLVSGLSGIAGYFSGAVTNSELVIESLFCITVFFYALARTGAFCGAGGKLGAAGEEAADGETAPAADPDADDTAAGATAADGETAAAEGTDAAPSDPDAPAADPDAPGDA